MLHKGYTSIEDFRGKLRPYVKPAGKTNAGKSELTAGKNLRHLLLLVLAVVVAFALSYSYKHLASYFGKH